MIWKGKEVAVGAIHWPERRNTILQMRFKIYFNVLKIKELLSLIFVGLAGLAIVLSSCNPVQKTEKVENGTPIDCTYTLPNLAQINQFIIENPNDAKLYRIRSQILLDSGNYQAALSDSKRALSLDPKDLYNYVVVGKAHRALGHIDSALSACITAEKSGFNDPDNFLLLGDLYLIIRQYKPSLEYLNKALKLAPFEPRIYFLKGILFAEQGDTAKAISNWQTSIEQDVNYGDGYAKLASVFMDRKDYATAEQYLRSGLRLRPEDAILHYDFGVFLGQKGFIDSAITEYKAALQRDKNLQPALLNLGLLEFQKRNYSEAKALLERAQTGDPKNPSIAYYLGLSYQYLGELENSSAQLDKVIKLDRDFVKDAALSLEKVKKKLATRKDSIR